MAAPPLAAMLCPLGADFPTRFVALTRSGGIVRLIGSILRAAIAIATLIASLGTAVALAAEDSLRVGQPADPLTLDMMDQTDPTAARVGALIFDGLLARGWNEQIVPSLAKDLPKLEDSQTWLVTLRSGIKFHNGEPFDAKSVEFSLTRLIGSNPQLGGTAFFEPIERVEVVNAYAVRIKTRRPWPLLPATLALSQASMYPPKAYAGQDKAFISTNPIGTGPYRFVRWVRGAEIVLEADSTHWRGTPKIKTVVFRSMPEDATRIAALQNGNVDLAIPLPPSSIDRIQRDPKLDVRTTPRNRTVQLMFYIHQTDAQGKLIAPYPGPTADLRVRKATAFALDVDELIKAALGGHAGRLATLLPSMYFGSDPQQKPIARDRAYAKKLLAEAGYPNGVDLALNAPVALSPVAYAIAGQLRETGIRLNIRIFETSDFNARVAQHEAGPVVLMGWTAPLLDAQDVYAPLFKSGSRYANWKDAEFDALVDQAAITMDPAKRATLYKKMTGKLLTDMPAIPLYQEYWTYGARKDIRVSVSAQGDIGQTKCPCPNDKTCCPISDDCSQYRKTNKCPLGKQSAHSGGLHYD